MTQVIKEKENHFLAYKLRAQSRQGKDPAWLSRLREKAGEVFESRDFPTTRDEEWKYTNVTPILKIPYGEVPEFDGQQLTADQIAPFTFRESRGSQLIFINGRFAREFSDLGALPAGCVAANLAEIPRDHGNVARERLAAYADYNDKTFIALNTASIGDGAFVYIPDGKTVEAPIHL